MGDRRSKETCPKWESQSPSAKHGALKQLEPCTECTVILAVLWWLHLMFTCRVTLEFVLIKLHTSNIPLQRQGCTSWLCTGTARGCSTAGMMQVWPKYCSTWSWHHKHLLIQNTKNNEIKPFSGTLTFLAQKRRLELLWMHGHVSDCRYNAKFFCAHAGVSALIPCPYYSFWSCCTSHLQSGPGTSEKDQLY